jgi:peptidoglycan hydrolase-like protein with peptidoglycan-binding domain
MVRLDGTNSNSSTQPEVRILRHSNIVARVENELRYDSFPRPVQDVLEAQIAMARLGISSGSIDGRVGPQTRGALRAFQQKSGLPVTAELDVTP